ncbi:MAG TPA: M20/M25/M40 family metallo-hydrolase [Gaiellales bacterium]|nr:M20/M25/M40 family metallo-hydrolase [Gaiellales bacterium]
MSAASDLLAELVRADSTNPVLVPGGAGEGEVAGLIARWLERVGLRVDVWDAAPGRPNVVGVLPGSGGGRSLMLCGHTDVVDAAAEGFRPEIRDGRMLGRGTADMKSGIVSSMLAAERLAAGPRLAGDVLVACVVDEEWASVGAEALVARHRADAAVLPEQTDLDVVFAHGGFAWFDLISEGLESAGGEPDLGLDAITLIGPVLTGLADLDRRLAAGATAEWGRPGIHASTVRGGQTYPTIPAECVLGVERCLMPGESVADSLREIEQLLAAARAADERFQGRFTTAIAREPVLLDTSEPVLIELIRAVAEELGREPVVRSDYGWMDSGVLVEAGIPCAVFGPTGGGLHTAVEWVDLESVETCARVLERLARTFCA